jgi:N4-gp56 family major capsid protein
MSGEITQSTVSTDQEKFVVARLLNRSMLRMVAASICDKVEQKKGTGLTAYFIRYTRMNVPMTTLTEGTDPSNSAMAVESVTVTLDQWGDIITLTDIAMVATLHNVLQQATDLLADNAQRVIDREVQIVWLAGTNVVYGDATVTTRATISTTMYASDSIIHKARVTMIDAGTPARTGPSQQFSVGNANSAKSINGGNHYVAICGPQVMADIVQAGTSLGTWASTKMYNSAKDLYNCEVGEWLGIRWVETNFIPKFNILGNTTTAVTSTNSFGTNTPVVTAVDGGGSLTSATTYYFKVTSKKKTRGFEENISIEHTMASTATANNESFTFAFGACSTDYVYNLYFGSATGDANLKLVQANIGAETVTVTTTSSSTTTAPANVNPTGTPTIHPIYFHGAESCAWVGLQNLQTFITKDESTIGNVLRLKKAVGYKFLAKSVIKDQNRILRVEVASRY